MDILVFTLFFNSTYSNVMAAEVKFGVQTLRGNLKAIKKWSALATYIEKETGLYPHWTLTTSPGYDKASLAKIKAALLKLKSGNAASMKAKIKGVVETVSLDRFLRY